MIIFFDLGNIFLNAKECGNLIIPNISPLIVPIIEIITNINTIFAPQGPNKLFAAKSTCASPKLIIVSGPIYILIPIKYKTYTGYVRKDMLDVDGKTETAQNTNSENTTSSEEIKDKIEIGYTGTIASKLDLKLVPSITSSNINTIEENSKITIKDIINKWSYVETDNKSGWVLTSKIKVSEQKNEEVKPEDNKEQSVEETKKEDNTEKTTSKEETKTEEKKKTEVTKYVSAETLNMRETANNNAKLINQLKVNTKVTVLETEGTWSKIKVNGKTGYVASKYLSDKKVDVTSRSEEISRGKENTQTENTSSKNESSTQGTSSSASGNNIVAYAKKYMGYKYVSGGSSPSTGFDCSGFTSYVYKQCGISISRSSSAQASNGTAVSKSNLQPGDLVIFNNRANTSIGHVGIYIGGNTFIHAGNSGTGVITTSLSDSYYSARYVTGRRIIN